MASDERLARPLVSMRPNRVEVMTPLGSGVSTCIDDGVLFESLVGVHNGAKQLTSGIVTMDGGAMLRCHTHSFSEAVTVLQGEFVMIVGGRRYTLQRLDNLVIPPGIPHSAANASDDRIVLHIAMGTDTPTRTLVEECQSVRDMTSDVLGWQGAEFVTRFRSAKRTTFAPNTTFIDYFNSDLVPDLEMSGGYGLFEPGGRLPAHLHDFDESICIVQGVATCLVEGRTYTLSDYATAMQPRGRVHYFINKTEEQMAMIWVYAGPQPTRVVVDESCASVEGFAWQ
jgi:quercetin dioxygenase-like cupin family protein